LTNNGSGSFGSNTTVSVVIGAIPFYLASADVNGDGKPDLIMPDFNAVNNSMTIFTNNGAGSFGSNATLHVGTNAASVVAADINGDSKPDLICANQGSSTVSIYTNNGSGIFGSNATLSVFDARGLAVADVNGDGKPDLLVSSVATNIVTVFTNNGSGVFGYNTKFNVGFIPVNLQTADLNGDGKPDFVTANDIDNTVSVVYSLTSALAMNGAVALTNNLNSFNGTFTGNGYNLTGLNASQLTGGTVPLAVLSGITSNQLDAATWQLATNLNGGNAALATNVVSGINITSPVITGATITGATITSSILSGNGNGLTNLNLTLPTNAPSAFVPPGAGFFKIVSSNYDLYLVTPLKTNLISLGH
jgi:hypothetical protein